MMVCRYALLVKAAAIRLKNVFPMRGVCGAMLTCNPAPAANLCGRPTRYGVCLLYQNVHRLDLCGEGRRLLEFTTATNQSYANRRGQAMAKGLF